MTFTTVKLDDPGSFYFYSIFFKPKNVCAFPSLVPGETVEIRSVTETTPIPNC